MSKSSVLEKFFADGHNIIKEMSINGLSGLSTISLDERLPSTLPQEVLLSMWDKSYLRKAVAYEFTKDSNKTVRIADIFCGAGGLSYGVREAIRACGLNAENVLAVDIDSVAGEVYRRNFDPTYFSTQNSWTSVTKSYSTRGSVAKFSIRPKLITEELCGIEDGVDILLGSPPCGGHSNSNNLTRRNDPRNKYYIVMPAMAVALGAKAVVVENVPGVRHDSLNVLDTAKGLFESSGYHIDEALVDSISLGLPQTRKRHILIASKVRRPSLGTVIDVLKRPQRNLRWGIGDLVDVDSREPLDKEAELSQVNKDRIKYLFDNDEYDLPDHQRPDSHKNGHTYPSIYGRLRWDRPAGTITTGFNTPGRGRYVHPERQRTITPHEAARIQGFPDTFEFRLINGETPSRSNLANMIGDAVPPQMGYVAGVAALATLDLDCRSG